MSNTENIRKMAKGIFDKKIQVGYHNYETKRELGEKWTDNDGVEWKQKNGYVMKLNRVPSKGIAPKCKDCDNFVIKSFDVDTYNRMNRCYDCQVYFEEELKWNKKNKIGQKGNKWFFWVKLQQLKRWDSIDKEIEDHMKEVWKEKETKVFDHTRNYHRINYRKFVKWRIVIL